MFVKKYNMFVKKMVPIQHYKLFWNKCSLARFRVYIFFQRLFQKIHVVINWACPKAPRINLVFFML